MTRRVGLVGVVLLSVAVSCGGSSTLDGSGGAAGGGTGGAGTGGATGGSGGGSGAGGIPSSWTSCAKPSDCLLRSASCCGSCGAATREDSVALNQTGATKYAAANCDGVGCPACYMPTDPTLLATCRAGTCVVVDLLEHESTACKDVSECRVRTNACCECGGPMDDEHLIAVGVGGGLEPLICDPNIGCPECAPVYPPKQLACDGGHCAIVGN